MKTFSIITIVTIVFVCCFYVAIIFLSKNEETFSTNLNGNVTGRDGEKEIISPIGVFNGIIGIK